MERRTKYHHFARKKIHNLNERKYEHEKDEHHQRDKNHEIDAQEHDREHDRNDREDDRDERREYERDNREDDREDHEQRGNEREHEQRDREERRAHEERDRDEREHEQREHERNDKREKDERRDNNERKSIDNQILERKEMNGEYSNFERILKENQYILHTLFVIESTVFGALVISIQTGEWVCITIPKKFIISSPTMISHSIRTIVLEPVVITFKKMKPNEMALPILSTPIQITNLEDYSKIMNPQDPDKIMGQFHQIDIDSEKTELLRDELLQAKNTLARIRPCVSSIRCKFSVLYTSCFAIVSMENDIYTFLVKNPISTGLPSIFASCDLETFYVKVSEFHKDTSKVYKQLRNILEDTNTQQLSLFTGKVNQFNHTIAKLEEKV